MALQNKYNCFTTLKSFFYRILNYIIISPFFPFPKVIILSFSNSVNFIDEHLRSPGHSKEREGKMDKGRDRKWYTEKGWKRGSCWKEWKRKRGRIERRDLWGREKENEAVVKRKRREVGKWGRRKWWREEWRVKKERRFEKMPCT